MEILSQKKPKARKNHVCNWCYGTIKKGFKYDYSVNIYDGDLYTWKNHFSCAKIANELRMFDNADEGLTADDFIQEILNEFQDIKIKTVGREYQIPDFEEQLSFVLNHHKINENDKS